MSRRFGGEHGGHVPDLGVRPLSSRRITFTRHGKTMGGGGGFIDVFSDDKGVTFLVIGDLSGKGLAAASQVATARHMLRFARPGSMGIRS